MAKAIAFVSSDRLGDSLIGMVTVNNLQQAGHEVIVFSDYLFQLRCWFPGFTIRPYPKSFAATSDWQDFDKVLVLFDRPYVSELRSHHPRVEVMSDSELFRTPQPMVDIQMAYCRRYWGVVDPVRHNGIMAATVGSVDVIDGRIVIHPTSVDPFKVWPQDKFLQLASDLLAEGFEPVFVVAPSEKGAWCSAEAAGYKVMSFDSLSDVAGFLTRANYFIGCDSGLGHLASCLGVPTVSIAIRRGTARLWAPSWHISEVVLAPSWLFCRPLKTRYWKRALGPKQVMKSFRRLVARTEIA
ncbi:glycosyltransferase family 9 protein [Gilvimarinus algae]|uniref:Glycosyltransferase family 9 protein n=1 Tax=Gilvimarinus algae TaxID=3058037 RepID=A0ABT8TCC5_9GAMM|nr:glycosyltransferase family 9 protein [Gilvimarinus sp. SDUM040014]MDO3381023.1 glycosyltransferase family 9 protein [Gilvimarinus sp. SDUM040014]